MSKMLFSSSLRTGSLLSHLENSLTTYIVSYYDLNFLTLCQKTQTLHVAQKAAKFITATPHTSPPLKHFLSST